MTQSQEKRGASANIHAEEHSRGRADSEIYRRMNAVEVWQAEHRGECKERARAREEWQRKTDLDIAKLEDAVTALKVKIALIVGLSSAGGGVVGSLIAQLIGPFS